MHWGKRLAARLKELGWSPVELQRRLGWESPAIIYKYLACKVEHPRGQKFDQVARAVGIAPDDLRHGRQKATHRESLAQPSVNELSPKFPAEAVTVPEIEVRAGANYAGGFGAEENTIEGGAIVSRDSVRTTWGFPAPFLRDELHVRAGRVHILPILGDSMVDVLFNGDRVAVNLDDTRVSRQGSIFALVDDVGSIIVKQVELARVENDVQWIRCSSRNPSYQPFELMLVEPVRIIGRVACRITRL